MRARLAAAALLAAACEYSEADVGRAEAAAGEWARSLGYHPSAVRCAFMGVGAAPLCAVRVSEAPYMLRVSCPRRGKSTWLCWPT